MNAQARLDDVLESFSGKSFINTDPIQVPHRYASPQDREVTAFISAIFSFGNVKAIMQILNSLLPLLGERPAEFLVSLKPKQIRELVGKSYYRFFSSEDISTLLEITRRQLISGSGKLEPTYAKSRAKDPLVRLADFRAELLKGIPVSPGVKFMFPHPLEGAAKRLHMFMRWVVRKDEVDLGLWSTVRPSNLIVPLDTHVFDICRGLKMTQRKAPSLKAALEITNVFKAWDANDPLKYDFAVCRLGVLKKKREFLASVVSET